MVHALYAHLLEANGKRTVKFTDNFKHGMPLRSSILSRFCLQFDIAGEIVNSFLQSPPFPSNGDITGKIVYSFLQSPPFSLNGDITITLHSSSEIPSFKPFLIFHLPNKKTQGRSFPLYRGILPVMETYQKKNNCYNSSFSSRTVYCINCYI